MKKFLISASSVVVGLLMTASTALAVSGTVGNDNNPRTQNDTYHNFVIVDTNHPATFNGVLTQFKYYATNTNPFQFVVVDASKVVKYISPVITPPAPGAQVFTPTTPVPIQTGWNVGMYFNQPAGKLATIPFEYTGSPAYYTSDNSGPPTVGTAITPAGTSGRTYSFVATETTPVNFSVKPWVFDPGNTNTIFSQWLKHIGLTDQQGNQNYGLLLSKNTTTATNAAAGASLKGVKNITLTELGFDIRHTDPSFGSHCGAGAPRFNVMTNDNANHFLGGCANATRTPTPGNIGWTRVRIDPSNPAQAFPPITAGQTIKSIDIVFDEGNDTPPEDFGLAELDNIDVNGTLVGQPGTPSKNHNDQDDLPDQQDQVQGMNQNVK